MGLLEGPFSTMAGAPEKSPLALMGCFLSLMGRFTKYLSGPSSLLKIPSKQPFLKKRPIKRFLMAKIASNKGRSTLFRHFFVHASLYAGAGVPRRFPNYRNRSGGMLVLSLHSVRACAQGCP